MTPPSDQLRNAFQKALVAPTVIQQGDIFSVGDDPKNPVVKFPEDDLDSSQGFRRKRTLHEQCFVMVIQDDKVNSNIAFPYVLIAPLTHAAREKEFTVKIPAQYFAADIPGDSFALLHLAQPILKLFLREHSGNVPVNSNEFTTIRATYLRLLGII